MSTKTEIRPSEHNRIYDLVGAAGVDVRDWAEYGDGSRSPAANPKYCYDWAFVEPNETVVLTLWYEEIAESDGAILLEMNPRTFGESVKGIVRTRAKRVDSAIQYAEKHNLPIRAVICEGKRRNRDVVGSEPAHVAKRMLDPIEWHVQIYDSTTGFTRLVRRDQQGEFIDQFSILTEDEGHASRKVVTTTLFDRNPKVRADALARAKGRCEYCGRLGFETPSGKIFLETHHVVPLGEGGLDVCENVVALCPNHHREAHLGINSQNIRTELLKTSNSTCGTK